MIGRKELESARKRAAAMLAEAGIEVTAAERANIEVADFGLADLQRQGLEIVVYENNDRYCAKELVLVPGQTCPEHRHPSVAGASGKRETFRCRKGVVWLYVPGKPGKRPRAKVPAGSEGLIFLPYLTGERTPYPDPHARGVFFGITLRSDRSHFVRAVLEGVAYGLRDSFSILEEMGVPVTQVRASGGGARSDVWRQIQADVTGHDHVAINIDEGPALGVALLAGVGTGVYSSVADACRSVIKVAATTKSDPVAKKTYDGFYPIYRSLYQSLKSDFDAVAKLA